MLLFPKIFEFLELKPGFDLIKESLGLADLERFQSELRTIQNAACSWLTLTHDISLNVFKGFATEDDLVDYFSNKAYKDNVTVLASK